MKIIAVVSGGLDSVTMLHKLVKEGYKFPTNEVKVLSIDYGQKHIKELEMAKYQTDVLGLEHKILKLDFMRDIASNSALTSKMQVPHGHYEDESMKQTVVPNRNMIIMSIATAWAVNEEYDAIAIGVHAGDHAIYPDCRPEFIEAMKKVTAIANYKPIDILTPYLFDTKVEIVRDGIKLGVDYAYTQTCYEGEEEPCGKCGSCQERALGFIANNIPDPAYKIPRHWDEVVESLKYQAQIGETEA